MDEDVVWVSRGAKMTEEQINCLAQVSVETSYYVYFRDGAAQKSYDPVYRKRSHAAEVASARNWLRERHRFAALPLPRKNRPLSNYAQAVEQFCGIRQGSLLVAADEHFITFANGALGEITANGVEHAAATETQFDCIMAAISAADLKSHGVFFGLVGNAAASKR